MFSLKVRISNVEKTKVIDIIRLPSLYIKRKQPCINYQKSYSSKHRENIINKMGGEDHIAL